MTSDIQLLPAYDLDISEPCPTYSARPSVSEIRLHAEPFASEGSSSTHWVCETKHMKIDLGPHIWGLKFPSYGLNGTVVGSIHFLNQPQHVEQVSVTFEGRLSVYRPYHGASTDTTNVILSRTFPLYASCSSSAFDWDTEHTFSIPIPAEIYTPGGEVAPTPPSYSCYYYSSALEAAYTVKVDMIQKISGIRKHETKVIPVYYLPKSHPAEPPLSSIPRPSRLRDDSNLYLSWLDRVQTTPVNPQWSNNKCKLPLLPFEKSAYFSIPNPPRFAAGDTIPFAVSFIYPENPVFAKMLTRCVRVILLKRVVFGGKRKSLAGKTEEVGHCEWILESGSLKSQNEFAEGIRLLRGSVRAGKAGEEVSWNVDSTGVQYVLRISVIPPSHMEYHVPNFQAEVVVQLTTDFWDHRDRCVIDGVPTPAVGLAHDPQANCIGQSSYAAVY